VIKLTVCSAAALAMEACSGSEKQTPYLDVCTCSCSFTDAAKLAWGEQRLAIAKRWTWLQAQVSDLEYKIRQYNELYRQVRTAKVGSVGGGLPQSCAMNFYGTQLLC